ncbi:MAG: hypothetical protein WCX31_10205 [Salinivirgaceae bacterium]
MKLENIEIGIGIGPLRFGMEREEAKKLMGEPDEVEEYDETEDMLGRSEIWHYDDQEISLSFEEGEEWTLVAIATSSEDVTIAGKKMIGLAKEEVFKFATEFQLGEMEEEQLTDEDGISSTVLSFYESGMNLWFEDNLLSEIQWGALWDEETLN